MTFTASISGETPGGFCGSPKRRSVPFISRILLRRKTSGVFQVIAIDTRKRLVPALVMLQAADKSLRESPDSPVELRREVGTVAAEIMACALTFYDGKQRWDLLREGERIFKTAMAPLSLEIDVDAGDAAQSFKDVLARNFGRVGLGTDENEIVVHHLLALDTPALGDEFLFRRLIVNENHIGVFMSSRAK